MNEVRANSPDSHQSLAESIIEKLNHVQLTGISTSIPVDELLQMIRTLGENESLYHQLTENLQEVLWIGSPDWQRIWYVNRAYELLWDKPRQSLYDQPMSWLDSVVEEDRQQVMADVMEKVSSGISRPDFVQYRIARRDGSVRWVLARAFPICDSQGRICRVAGLAADVTALKLAEQDLRSSESRFRALVDHAPVGILLADSKGRCQIVNQRWCEMSGLSPREAAGRGWVRALNRSERHELFRKWREATRGGRALQFDLHFRAPAEKGNWQAVSIDVLHDEAGRTTGYLETFTDITLRKMAEERLRQSEGDYRTLAENLTGIVYRIFLREGNRMRFFNAALEQLTGFRSEELTRGDVCCIEPLILEEDRKCVVQTVQNAVSTRQPFEVDYRLQCKNGDIRHFSERGKPVYGEDDVPVYIDGVIFDITEKKQREKALQQSEDRLRAFVTASSDAVYRMNPDWSDVRQLKSLEFIADPDCPGRTWIEMYVHPDDRTIAISIIKNSIRTKRIFELEHRVLRADGQVSWIFSRAVPLLDEKGEIIEWFGTASDITERKRAEDSLRKSRDELEVHVQERTKELSQTVQALHERGDQLRQLAMQLSGAEQRERQRLAKILHDHIQQLIVAARWQIKWIAQSQSGDAGELQEAMETAISAMDEAMEASRSLAIDLCPPVLEEVGLIGALGWLASRMKEKNRFTVNLHMDSNAEPAQKEIRFLLYECARELVLNAIKHAGVDKMDIVLTRTGGGQVKLMVRDRGRGFDTALIERRAAEGATFGMFSIQQRLAHMGGQMGIKAAPGKGTEVALTVPVDLAEPMSQAPPQTAMKEAVRIIERSAEYSRYRILIVDDHAILREGLKRIFRNMPDIEIVGEAADGPQAVELAERLAPDVVLMDVSLGEMSGIEATRRILQKNPGIRIIGLSMFVDVEIANAMRKAGAVGFLTKSASPTVLIEKIRNFGGEFAS